MQFLPASISTHASQSHPPAQAAQGHSSASARDPGEFAGMYANYIEEGREEYCGRPAGFPAQEKNSGTLSEKQAELFKKNLRQRDVDEENLAALEQLMQNGHGLTIANAFKVVGGTGGRMSEALEGDERDAFKMLLGKMGLSKDQVEDLLTMSDNGQRSDLLSRLRQTLGSMDGTMDVSRKELASMLRALDLSDATSKKIMNIFAGSEDSPLAGTDIQALLVEAGKDLALKASNSRHAQQQMREAMKDALTAAKAEEQSAPVDDVRGNRRSDRLKAVMDDTINSRAGVYDIKDALAGSEEGFAHGNNRKDSRGGLLTESGKKGSSRATSSLLKNVGLAGEFGVVQNNADQARNLDIVSKSVNREIFSQVEQGILQSVRNGSQRLTLQLMPEELGKLNLVLTMRQGELKALITAENADSATILGDQMAKLKETLEEQGIKVAELEVQTRMDENRFSQEWNNQKDHNEMTDSREKDRIMRLSRMRREAAGMDDPVAAAQRATLAVEQGLHIVA